VANGSPVTFSGSCSGGTPAYSYQWSFGDGSSVQTTPTGNVAHGFTAVGSFSVSFTCVDASGATATTAKPIAVTASIPPPSVAALSASNAPLALSPVNFTVACTDSFASSLSYSWNFGDGSAVVTTPNAAASHTYSTPGSYTVTFTCTDTMHNLSSISNLGLSVGIPAPTVVTAVSLTGSAAIDWPASLSLVCNGTPTWTYTWDFGDGSPVVTITSTSATGRASHDYSAAGNYTVRATCDDGSGTPASSSTTITVSASGPSLGLLAGHPGGSGYADLNGPLARFSGLSAIAIDGAGNSYVVEIGNNGTVRKIDSAHNVTTLAGGASPGYKDGTGAAAFFYRPTGIAADQTGTVYVADAGNFIVRKVSAQGVVTTLAGTPTISGTADGVGASAQFTAMEGIAVDSTGNLYLADNQAIRKISASGNVTTLAGLPGTSGSADGTGSAARFNGVYGVCVDSSGNVYATDLNNQTIRKITSGGVVTTLAGAVGVTGNADGTGSAARFNYPTHLSVDAAGNLYVADSANQTFRRVTPTGVVTTIAGSGSGGYADGQGTAAIFNQPQGVASDASGNLVVTDANSIVRTISSSATVVTIAGAANYAGYADGTGTSARFADPVAAATDAAGNVYVADLSHVIRKITPAGMTTTLAGSYNQPGFADGTGSAARFNNPRGVAVDASNNVYVADTSNNVIRKITPAGVVTTIAGSAGQSGSADGTGAAARFNWPQGIVSDPSGNLFVTDLNSYTVRAISTAGVVTTFAGTAGSFGTSDGQGTAARFSQPAGIAMDGVGNLFVSDGSSMRKITPAGTVTTLATSFGYVLLGAAVDAAGNVYAAGGGSVVYRITPDGIFSVAVGTPSRSGFVPGVTPGLVNAPQGVAVSGSILYVVDTYESSIALVTPLP